MKNLRVAIFSAIFLALFALISCRKDGKPAPIIPIPNPSAASSENIVYYTVRGKIYSTNLIGTDRKLVLAIDTLNPDSYILSIVRSVDGNKLYFLQYIFGGPLQIKLYSVNKDGIGLTLVKNMPPDVPTGAPTYKYFLIKATDENKIVFSNITPIGAVETSFSLQTINTDGTGQTTLTTLPIGSAYISGLSLAVNRYISFAASTIRTGTISGGTIGSPSIVGLANSSNALSLSNDGLKIAYANWNAAGKIEIYVYDVTTGISYLKFTHTVLTTTPPHQYSIRWVAGTDKILLGYFQYPSPSGSGVDFTQYILYTLSNSTEARWKFEGEGIGIVLTE